MRRRVYNSCGAPDDAPGTPSLSACRAIITLLIPFALIAALALPVAAEQRHHVGQAFDGYSGLLRTPNAEVTAPGTLHAGWNSQRVLRHSDFDANNYVFSFGVLPYLEIGGRYWDQGNERFTGLSGNDLSSHVKLQLPLFPEGGPRFAIGAQDPEGGAVAFSTKYAVGSLDLGRHVRLSGGYGLGPQRLDGLFGGIEVTAREQFDLLAEYETGDFNIGARWSPELPWLRPGHRLELTSKYGLDSEDDHLVLGIGLSMPLGYREADIRPRFAPAPLAEFPLIPSTVVRASQQLEREDGEQPAESKSSRPPISSVDIESLKSVAARLESLGFRNLEIGYERSNTEQGVIAVILYEDVRFQRNGVDALGVALGTVAMQLPDTFQSARVVPQRFGIALAELEVELATFRAFLVGPTEGSYQEWPALVEPLWNDWRVTTLPGSLDLSEVSWVELDSVRRPWADLILSPALNFSLGTEVGPFDYSLGLRSEIVVPAWKGAALSASVDAPINETGSFAEGGPFNNRAVDGGVNALLLHQTLWFLPSVLNMSSAGSLRLLDEDYQLLENSTVWSPGDGRHQLLFRQGIYKPEQGEENRDISLLAYRHYLPSEDLTIEAALGDYLFDDRGWSLSLTRNVGDAAFSVFYRSTDQDLTGVSVSLPLTWRREPDPGLIQVRASERWSVGVSTVVADLNRIRNDLAVLPRLTHNLHRSYLNHDRWSVAYLREHSLRLRDAYWRYGVDTEQERAVASPLTGTEESEG